jgi:hypothetical protein
LSDPDCFNHRTEKLPNFALVSRFFCREIVPLASFKIAIVFHHVWNGLLFAALSPLHRLGQGEAEQAVAGKAAGCQAVAAVVAALTAAGRTEAAERNHQVVVAALKIILYSVYSLVILLIFP